ncbi:TPA: type 4a pilus biogenesis protein PilO [Neisseria polysaccharea]
MASKSSKTNLDLNNLHLLNLPARLFIALLVVAAMLGLGYAGLFKSQMESLEEYEAKETELKNTYKQKSIDAASLNNLRDELASIRSAFDIMLKQLPTDAEIPNLVQELHQAGSSNGLRLDSVMPQPPVDDGPIKRLPYSISITGNYEQISQFTRDVGSLSRIITLESLKIAQSPENGGNPDGKSSILNLSAIATTYKAKSVEELAAEAAQQQAAEAAQNAEQK